MELTKHNIREHIRSEKSYQIFDIKYSDKEKKYIKKFKIEKGGNFISFNNLDNLEIFINNIGDNSDRAKRYLIKIIKKILKKILKAYKTEYYWIAIRIKLPSPFFDIPRWHCDKYYFSSKDKLQQKFITTLKGPSTLLIDTTDDEKKYFFELKKDDLDVFELKSDEFDEKERKYIDENIKGKKIQLTNSQGLIFAAGDKDKCLIHSEPKQDDNRIFISILPGTKDEIEELKNKMSNT